MSKEWQKRWLLWRKEFDQRDLYNADRSDRKETHRKRLDRDEEVLISQLASWGDGESTAKNDIIPSSAKRAESSSLSLGSPG